MRKASILWAAAALACAACGHGRSLAEVRASDAASAALSRGDFAQAIDAANEAIQLDPTDPWPYYDRGCALGDLKRTDEAIASFQQAETRFSDRLFRSISVWGRARAYAIGGKCSDAQRTYKEYAEKVRASDPASADMATKVAATCVPPPALANPQK
jgi:tetratricopeptide (TPR) repeat protein